MKTSCKARCAPYHTIVFLYIIIIVPSISLPKTFMWRLPIPPWRISIFISIIITILLYYFAILITILINFIIIITRADRHTK